VGAPVDIYVRISRVGKRQNVMSDADQEDIGRSYLRDRHVKAGKVLADIDESGGKWDRPGLQEALRRVKDGKSGGLVVAWLDRVSRDSEHAHRLIREITEAGGRIYAPDAPDDWTTPEGELQVGIMFAFAQYVRKRQGHYFDRAKARAVANGVASNPRQAPGIRRRADRRLEPDPEVAPIMRAFFELRARGAGPAELAEHLEAHGVRTSMGSAAWSKPAIYALIRNRVYLGELRQGKHVNVNALEPVVDEALWLAAQYPAPRRAARPRSTNPYLLSGLLRCANCRYSMQPTLTSRGVRIYRCHGRHAAGRCPGPARINAAEADRLVTAAFWELAEDARAQGLPAADPREGETRQRLDAARRALAVYRDDPDLEQTIGDMGGRDVWREGLRVRSARVEALERELGKVAAPLPAMPRLATLRAEWDQMPTEARRQHLAALIDTVAVLPLSTGLAASRRLIIFPGGTGPTDVPRRGFRERPTIRPFDLPAKARVPRLEVVGEHGP
jgi:DNA invertase Pin-like site-specific DNA recombinase